MLKRCTEDESKFIGMGGRAFYPEDGDGSLLRKVDS
jgi:hypothetical protein